jgi:hypothetical protein
VYGADLLFPVCGADLCTNQGPADWPVCPRLCWQHRFEATVNRLAVPTHVVIVVGVVASERVDAVPGEVLAEFGMAGVVPVRLPGGQGTRWRAGPVVRKPADSVWAGRWFAEVYDGVE